MIENTLLSTGGLQKKLENLVPTSKVFIIISAYITEVALKWISSIVPSECNVTLVARLKSSDILNKSSDLKAIELALESNWQVFRLPELHAKIYLINDNNLFVGSANCTSNGLKLFGEGNIETSVELDASEADRDFIKTIIEKSDPISWDILQKMKEYISTIDSGATTNSKDWPKEIFQPNTDLWVSDLLWNSPSDLSSNSHDMGLLDIRSPASSKEVSKAFVNTKVFKWLYATLKDSESGELYFGSLTAALHKNLCDNPTPYRRAIKDLLSVLLSYCEEHAAHLIQIDRPRHSQRITLLN
jgi:hypothetical protein